MKAKSVLRWAFGVMTVLGSVWPVLFLFLCSDVNLSETPACNFPFTFSFSGFGGYDVG